MEQPQKQKTGTDKMTAILWIPALLILFIFSLDRLIEYMYRHKKRKHHATPAKYQIEFDEIKIPGVNGSQLYGWWIPTTPTAPTLIMVHGWGRNLGRMMPYIRQLHLLGYNLLAFDARNHGHSSPEKHPSVGTFSEDTLAAIDFVAKSNLVSTKEIGLVGLSIGGGAVINAAGRDDRVKSVITVGAISHPVAVMKLEFQKRNIPDFVPRLLFQYMQLRFGIDFDKIAPINQIAKTNAPVFLMHGAEDETIPLAQGQALAKAGDPAQTSLWIIPGKGHGDGDSHPEFWEKVETFLHQTMPHETVNHISIG